MSQLEYFENPDNMTEEKLQELNGKINEYTKRRVKIDTQIADARALLTKLSAEKRSVQDTIESLGFRKSWTVHGINQLKES